MTLKVRSHFQQELHRSLFPAKETSAGHSHPRRSSGLAPTSVGKAQKHFLHLPQDHSHCSLQRHMPGCPYPPAYSCLPLANTCKDISPLLVSQGKHCPGEQRWLFSCSSLSQSSLGITALAGEQSFTAPAWNAPTGLSPLQGDLSLLQGDLSPLQGDLLCRSLLTPWGSARTAVDGKHVCP